MRNQFQKHLERLAEHCPLTTYLPDCSDPRFIFIMAGCKPEYMPALLATIEAFSKSGTDVRSTNSFSYMRVINGPIRKELGMNAATYALGPGNHANATIGRFLSLAITNLAGGQIGVNLMGSQGNVSSYSFCFPENEESSPWEAFAVFCSQVKKESNVVLRVVLSPPHR